MEDEIQNLIKGFYPYAKKRLGFNKPARIFLVQDKENAKNNLGKTGYYDPTKMEVYAYITSRHPKDILRSISHELVHHYQNCSGKMKQNEETPEGYAQKDPHLRELEKEAYTLGNLIFRDFEDSIKAKGQDMKQINESKDKDPDRKEEANDHYAKRAERVYKKLIDSWKLKPKEDKKEKEEGK